MNNILSTIYESVEKVGIGAIVFLGAYISNILLGAWNNVKIEGYEFDWKMILNSVQKFIILGITIGILSIVTSVLPMYATYIGIEIQEDTMNTISSIVITSSFMTATIKYLADCMSKIKSILKIS